MTLLPSDYWFNALSDTTYDDRCRRKKKLHQRKSPNGNYHVDEEVWACHPNDNVMYIASVISVNNHHRTCHVVFIDDGQTFSLPISHLRHITLEDIKHNRYVDYGHGWTERTSIGAINTYSRYGELEWTRFNSSSDDSSGEANEYTDDEASYTISSVDVVADDKGHYDLKSTNEPIWIKIPDPEEPTVTYCNCPIWNASSYAEAENMALELVYQDPDYMKAVQQAQHRMKPTQLYETPAQIEFQPVEPTSQVSFTETTRRAQDRIMVIIRLLPPLLEEMDNSQLLKIWPDLNIQLLEELRRQSSFTESNKSKDESISILNEVQLIPRNMEQNISESNYQAIETAAPILVANEAQVDKSSQEVFDRQLLVDQTRDAKHQSPYIISEDHPTGKEVATQTEPSISTPMANTEQRYKSIDMTYSNQSTKYVPTSTMCKKKKMYIWSSKFQLSEATLSTTTCIIDKQHKLWTRFRVNNLFTYGFTKLLPFLLLAIMVGYYRIIGSSFADQTVYSSSFIKNNMVPIDVIGRYNIILFMLSTLSLSSTIEGPGRSSVTLWFYPFAVP